MKGLIEAIEAENLKAEVPVFNVGDTVSVGYKIIEGDKGFFIAMPSRRKGDGEYHDVAHPINPEVRAMFEEEILKAYDEAEESE